MNGTSLRGLLREALIRLQCSHCRSHGCNLCISSLLLFLFIPLVSLQAQDTQKRLGLVDIRPPSGVSVPCPSGFMVPYTESIPGTNITFEMIPVPGGVYRMGTPSDEVGHRADEEGVLNIEVEPMWVAKTEVTWEEYRAYTECYSIFKKRHLVNVRAVTEKNRADAVTVPTPLYDPSVAYEFGGEDRHPAVVMTQFAAKQYTKWLSKFTGNQYRIPTEGEWEYFARGGTVSSYSFGNDDKQLSEYACYDQNHREGPPHVGSKKPNPFGLHDVHGSVWEWVVDGYSANGTKDLGSGKKRFLEAVRWPNEREKRVVRGGSFMDDATRCRSGSKLFSEDEAWSDIDPDAPRSPWWFTSDPARAVGFRIVRSLEPLSQDDIQRFWEADDRETQIDVNVRLQEGRGAIGLAVPELADDLTRTLKRQK